MNKQTNHNGFTLIELMMVVGLLSILVAIALPSYLSFVQKGKRSDGMAALLNTAQLQEQFMLDRNTYSANIAGLGVTNPTPEGHYNITVNAATANCPINRCFSLTATPIGSQTDDEQCASFTLTSNGTKTALDADGNVSNDCWSRQENMMFNNYIKTYLTIMLMTLMSVVTADMPRNEYACHVLTETNKLGIIFMQANDEPEARVEAFGRMAYISEEKMEKTITVLQCILERKEKFNDSTAQKLYESIPK